MNKKQEKEIRKPQQALGYSRNDRVAVIYAVKVSSVRVVEKPRESKKSK